MSPKQHEKTFAIKNPKSGLVLDATEMHVKIQPFTGGPAQLWTLECIDHGRFVIINKGNGKILNIEGGAKSMSKLITYPRTAGRVTENEQWHIHQDGLIVCPVGQLAVDIFQGNLSAGNHLIAYSKNGTENQIFKLEYQ